MFDLIINNAHIYDGTGGASYMGSVAVKDGKIVAVLDIDSEHLATFDTTDKHWLEQIVSLLPL